MVSTFEKIIDIAHELHWEVLCDKYCCELRKESPCGLEFFFDINVSPDFSDSENVSRFMANFHWQIRNFDPSYETSLYLDNTGHGNKALKAPYDMKDVYNEMLLCKQMMIELYAALASN